jgi:hypothetical protein
MNWVVKARSKDSCFQYKPGGAQIPLRSRSFSVTRLEAAGASKGCHKLPLFIHCTGVRELPKVYHQNDCVSVCLFAEGHTTLAHQQIHRPSYLHKHSMIYLPLTPCTSCQNACTCCLAQTLYPLNTNKQHSAQIHSTCSTAHERGGPSNTTSDHVMRTRPVSIQ